MAGESFRLRSSFTEVEQYNRYILRHPDQLELSYELRDFRAVPPEMRGYVRSPSQQRYLTDQYGMHG